MDRILPYLRNGFWLMLPVLAFNLVLAGRLPTAFQPDVFWRDIPPILGWVENGARTLVTGLPLAMPLGFDRPMQKWGLWLYLVGLVAYGLAWAALIMAPESGWGLGAAGFLAPAATPLLWLAGIGMIGAGRWRLLDWAYGLAVMAFIASHGFHTWSVYLRQG